MVDRYTNLFVGWALLFQLLLIVHFSIRKWRFEWVARYGAWFYALGVPALLISILLAAAGAGWALWTGGLLQFVWSAYGYVVEYVRKIEWRDPPYWRVFWPYVTLYLGVNMFYWWPQGLVDRRLWFLYGALFLVSTLLNVSSHRSKPES